MLTRRKGIAIATSAMVMGALVASPAPADNREFVQTTDANFAIAVTDFTTLNTPRNTVELNWGETWRGDLELSPGGRIAYYTHGYVLHFMRCDVENGADEARVEVRIDMNGLAEIRC